VIDLSTQQQSEINLMTEDVAMRLDQFLKLRGIAGSGGQAKLLIQDGAVLVNGTQETRRRRKLTDGDVIQIDGHNYAYNESDSFA
jgi:ribosome-associated protein